jgi:hypothetical protein
MTTLNKPAATEFRMRLLVEDIRGETAGLLMSLRALEVRLSAGEVRE